MRKTYSAQGFTLIEVLSVIAIIGVLVSILVPMYQIYRATAQEKACLAVRRHMLMDEADQYLATGEFAMEFDERYQCPSGGVYVWVLYEGDDHPVVICSIHGEMAVDDEGGGDDSGGPGNSNKNKNKNKNKSKKVKIKKSKNN